MTTPTSAGVIAPLPRRRYSPVLAVIALALGLVALAVQPLGVVAVILGFVARHLATKDGVGRRYQLIASGGIFFGAIAVVLGYGSTIALVFALLFAIRLW